MGRIESGPLDDRDYDDEKAVPHSHRLGWYKCGHCANLHLRLYDETGALIMVATADPEMVADMLREVRGDG